MTKEEVLKELDLPADIRKKGLTDEQANERLEKYGENKLTEKEKETLLQKIWKQVNNVLVGILVFVAIISAVSAIVGIGSVLQNWIQVGIIVGVIVINTAIGIIQEGSAEQAAEALKAMLSADAVVVRGGTEKKVPANLIVPGDVVILGLGDRIPADLRMIEVSNLASAEAALTGESVPIDKVTEAIPVPDGTNPSQVPLGDRKNMCFSATLIAQGSGAGIVIATGDYTEIGTINSLVNKVEKKKTAVLEQIDIVSTYIAIFIGIVAVFTFLYSFFTVKDEDGNRINWLIALNIALVCAVAMIPEGLEAIVTVVYAWAVSKMAKENAIVRALPAVETLGSVTVICSDKTGTLTTNVMSLTAFVTSNAHYKNNVHATDRTPKNFVREDEYLGERSDIAKQISAKEAIKSAAGTSRHTRKKGEKDFQYTMSPSVIEENMGNAESTGQPKKINYNDTLPVRQGDSPDVEFFRQALVGGVLCSKCTLGKDGGREGEIGNPTELSILRASYWTGIDVNTVKDACPIIAEVPFSSEYKFMATVHPSDPANDGPGLEDKLIIHVKGAPDRMVALCDKQAKAGLIGQTEPIDRDFWIEQIAILSSHGLRVLALLRGTLDKGAVKEGEQLKPEFVRDREPWLTMVGLCAIVDPPRPECVVAIEEAHHASVRVAMITGDHKDTALAIGAQLGLVDSEHPSAITGPELDAMSDEELKKAVMTYNVFARSSPENKIRIVKALQAQGEVASMTGDGVNDAPALKAADMGVAMGKEGTDVAREAAEMILADDNFATIVVAVREGRVVWDNLRKVLMINTPINNAQGLSVLFGIICGFDDVILTGIQVLYCNLICAVTLGFVAAVEPAEDGIMDVPPRRVGKRLIGRFLFLRIALASISLVTATVGSVFWAQAVFVNQDELYDDYLPKIRSQASNTLTFGACFVTLGARFSYNSAFHPRLFKGNKYAWYSVFITGTLQVCITYIPGLNSVIFQMGPMEGFQWGIVFLFGLCVFFIMECEKAVRRALKAQGADTDDTDYGFLDIPPKPDEDMTLPKGVSHLKLTELKD
ncbi:cation-transporting P-type ATPase [Nitzschia inconspicua]|uniref:Cation-transporting P-type ATPase n=1 Tax=Nitzschia inconspicua TaxID=303405 RepID=A0A9K3KIL6_9STRA|nr:cation-transporting P-type ATPase [Nitzschia inconspicua]